MILTLGAAAFVVHEAARLGRDPPPELIERAGGNSTLGVAAFAMQ